MKYHNLLFVVILAAGLFHENHGVELPTHHCNQDLEHFNPLKTYWIKYTVKTKGIVSSTPEMTQSEITCDGRLNTNAKCQYILTVTKCHLSNYVKDHFAKHEKSDEFSAAMQKYPVAFGMYNGTIDGVVIHQDEPLSILNFKKGMISSILTKKTAMTPSEEDPDFEMRTDVHGTCPVKYVKAPYYQQEDKKQYMRKDMSNCHYPKRNVYPYSPFSMIWNTTFIQRQLLDSTTTCNFKFTKTGILESSSCQESHALYISYRIDRKSKVVETEINAEMTITKETDAEQVGLDSALYRLTGIQYEYKTELDKPKENPPNFKEDVLKLLGELSTSPEKPIDPHTSCHFDDLLDLLRKASDLSVLGEDAFAPKKCWASKSCTPELQRKEVLRSQVWKSALIQCNRAPCVRAFRSFVELVSSNQEYVDLVFQERELEYIYFQWTLSKMYDIEMIEELLKLAKFAKNRRYLPTALSIIASKYWAKHKDELNVPDTIKEVVKLVKSPIRENCVPAEGYEDIHVITALQGIANLGPLYEKMVPDYLKKLRKCIFNKDTHWVMGTFAIQATRSMSPSGELHDLLLEILKSPNIEHEDHVVAYFVLAEKFGNAELVKEIVEFLNKSEEPGFDFNLRTFIISHMRTVARTREPNRIKFAKAIREAMVNTPKAFQIIPEHVKPINDKDSYTTRLIPWDIHLDNKKLIEEGKFSKYDEDHYHYDFALLHNTIKRFGYKISDILLYDGKSDVPYGYWVDEHYRLFSRNFNMSTISKLARGDIVFDPSITRYLEESFPYKKIGTFLKMAFFKDVKTSSQADDISSTLEQFPYQVDEQIFQNLAKLHRDQVQDFSKDKKPKEVEAFYQFGYYNNFQGVGTFDTVKEYFRLFTNYKDFQSISNYVKLIEGDAIIPTIAGIPLNWTTDAYLIENGWLDVPEPEPGTKDIKLKTDISYSGLLALKQGMHLDLPGYLNNGAQQFLSLSTSVGATVEATVNAKDRKARLQIELPQRPMQLLSFRRTHSIINNNNVMDIASVIKPTEVNWCSYKFGTVLGLKFCHSESFINVTEQLADLHNIDNKCQELVGNAHWDYTTEYIAKHKVALQFGLQMSNNEDKTTETVLVDVKTRDAKTADKFNTIFKLTHEVRMGEYEYETKATMPILPTFKLHAIQKKLGDGIHFKSEATIHPKQTTYIDFWKRTQEDKASSVPKTTYALNYTTTTDYYGFNYESQKLPTTPYHDFDFKYKSLRPNSETELSWFQRTFLSDTLWDDKGEHRSASFHFHRKVEDSSDRNDPDFVHRCKTTLTFPRNIVKVKVFHGATPSTVRTFQVNCTNQDAQTNELKSYIKLTGYKKKVGTDPWTNIFGVNITVPENSYSAKFAATRGNIPPVDPEGSASLTLTLRQENLKLKPDKKPNVERWWSPNTDVYDAKISTVKWHTYIDSNVNTPFKLKTEYQEWAKILFGLATRKFGSTFEYTNDDSTRPAFEITFQSEPVAFSEKSSSHSRKFLLKIPSQKYSFDGELNLDFSLDTELLLWRTKTNFADVEPIFYTFNVSSPPANGFVFIHEDLTSPWLNRKSSLVVNYVTMPFNPNLEWRIKTKTKFDPIHETDFHLKIADKQGSLQYKGALMDIKGSASYKPEKTVATLDFNSKVGTAMPTMKWNYNYPNDENAVTFTINMIDTHKDYYIFANTKLDATRLVFKICDTINCKDLGADSDHFIAKLEYSLEDPQELTRTVIYNPQTLKHIEKAVITRLKEIVPALFQENKAILKKIETTTSVKAIDLRRQLWDSVSASFNLMGEAFETAKPVGNLAVDIVRIFVQPFHGRKQKTRCWYSIFKGINDPSRTYFERITDSDWYEPGPVPDKSYVTRTELPLYWTSFNSWPLQFNPSVIRDYNDVMSSFRSAHYEHYKEYHDKKYTRHALLTGSGTIQTFDNKVMHLQTMQPTCPYLLSHDLMTNKFSIYYEYDNVHFLFPDVSLELSSTGKLKMNNEKDVKLPYESKDGDIKVTQKGSDLVELTTSYNFKVICNIVDFHCVFYTDTDKFNQLIGLLGNNNDNPIDDTEDVITFELSGSYNCRNYKFLPPSRPSTSKKYLYSWNVLLKYPDSPTLACHDIVNVKEFLAPSYMDQRNLPCSLINSYAALCAAKGVEMPASICSTNSH